MLSTEQLKEKMKECSKRIKNTAKACQDFYSKYLQGESILGTVDGEKVSVAFTKRGKEKLFNLVDKKHMVTEILPYVPEVIATGKYAGKTGGYKDEIGHKYFSGFLYFQKKVPTPKGIANVVVDVGITKGQNIKQEYSFITNKDSGYKTKQEKLREVGIILENTHVQPQIVSFSTHSMGVFSDATIPLSFEFVNVRIENIFENALEAAYANEFHDNFSDVNYAFKLEL